MDCNDDCKSGCHHPTVPGMPAIPQEAIDLAREHGSIAPDAGEGDMQIALLENNAGPAREPCPACRPCTLCAGLGEVDPETAHHWRGRHLTSDELVTHEAITGSKP